MSRARAQHPTDRPNYSIFYFDGVGFAFSYETLVGLRLPGHWTWQVHENIWSKTTGKHLNDLNNDHTKRLTQEEFETLAESIPQLQWPKPKAEKTEQLVVERITNTSEARILD